jgi:hypothetical protein
MSLQELGSVGEFIGGIAVLVTLIYLAVQLRQGNRLQSSEAIRTFMHEYNDTLAQMEDPTLAELYRLGSKNFEGLPRHGQHRIHVWLEQVLRTNYAAFIVDPRDENPVTDLIHATFATQIRLPGFQQWWRVYSTVYELIDAEWVRKVEELGSSYPSVYDFCPWLEPTDEELREGASS